LPYSVLKRRAALFESQLALFYFELNPIEFP
jgi:hypothetical protein